MQINQKHQKNECWNRYKTGFTSGWKSDSLHAARPQIQSKLGELKPLCLMDERSGLIMLKLIWKTAGVCRQLTCFIGLVYSILNDEAAKTCLPASAVGFLFPSVLDWKGTGSKTCSVLENGHGHGQNPDLCMLISVTKLKQTALNSIGQHTRCEQRWLQGVKMQIMFGQCVSTAKPYSLISAGC